MKTYVESRLEEGEDAEEFAAWAFGEDYNSLRGGPKFVDAWNERHGDILKLEVYESIHLSLYIMIKIWRKHASRA